jgi:hypothetical protein
MCTYVGTGRQIKARRVGGRGVSPLLDGALRLMDPCSFPHGIDVQWVQRNCNAEAGTVANAGLRARKHERRILFYDN